MRAVPTKYEELPAKLTAARRFASHYNTRMSVRGHRWVNADGEHITWEYAISPAGSPRRCFDRVPRPGGEHQ